MTDERRQEPERRAGQARAPRARSGAARQLDAFTGRDVRGAARQLDLFSAPAPNGARTPTGEVEHG